MGKKRIVKKRITKKKQVKKQLKPEYNAKKDVSNMSRLEYQQAMMDPRFRAAMMGFNNPMPGLNQQMNRELHEKENKNNELTRQITLQADLANQKEKYIKLKEQKQEEGEKQRAEIAKLNSDIQIQQMQRKMEIEKEQFMRQVEEIERKQEFNEFKLEKDAELRKKEDELKQKENLIEDQKRRHQQEMKSQQMQYELNMKEKEKEYQDERIAQEEKITALKTEMDKKDTVHKMTEEKLNREAELYKTELKSTIQPVINKLESQTNANNREIDISNLIQASEERVADKTKDLLISQFKRLEQEKLDPIQQQNQALQNKIQETKAESDAIKNIMQANHEKQMLAIEKSSQDATAQTQREIAEMKNYIQEQQAELTTQLKQQNLESEKKILQSQKNSQDATFQTQREISEMRNEIKVNQEVFNQQQKQRDLETEKKILEQHVNGNVKKKHDKEVQQSKLRTAQLEKQLDKVKYTNQVLGQEDQMRQELAIDSMKADPDIKQEEIYDVSRFNDRMNKKIVEAQEKMKTYEKQQLFNQRVMNYNQHLKEIQAEQEQEISKYFTERPFLNQYTEEILGYRTNAEKYNNLQTIFDSFNEKARENALLAEQMRQSPTGEYGEILLQFDKEYQNLTGENPREFLAQVEAEKKDLKDQVEQAQVDSARKLQEITDAQERMKQDMEQLGRFAGYLYDNANQELRQAALEEFPEVNISTNNEE